MSVIGDIWKVAKELGAFVLGDKKQPKLEEPIGELETEREAQKMADRRRERAAKKNGDR